MPWRRRNLLLLFLVLSLSALLHISGTVSASHPSRRPLSRFVRHYEPLQYDHEELLHARTRRSTRGVEVKFTSHSRPFHLKLYPDDSAFMSGHVATDGHGNEITVDTSFLFDGYVVGEKDSYVHGAIRKGIFEGKIYLDNDTFVVEPAKLYFDNPTSFHSVIYSEDDVVFPEMSASSKPHKHFHTNDSLGTSCGLSDATRSWMRQMQSSAVEEPVLPSDSTNFEHPFAKYRKELNQPGNRTKRGTVSDPDKNRLCNLYIQTDKFLWDAVYEREKDDQRTREEILSMISSHVKAITRIYGNHRFGDIVGIQFAVQRTTINDSSSCSLDDRSPFCQKYLDVSNLLNANSMTDHSAFCLAFLFTYRDFSGGTLGLAWVASANGPSGGICETYKRYTETSGGKRVQNFKSLNTGVITFVNYGMRVAPTVSHLTLAHEVGHNFGAAHDPPTPICQPTDKDHGNNNFIMYPSATDGSKPNNDKFSPCSIESMTAVLKAVLNQLNGKRNCFVPNDLAYCGNKITEKGEECDCGYNMDECKEKCCYPRQLDEASFKEGAKMCTLRYDEQHGRPVQCSPSQGPCCTPDCTFIASASQPSHQCREQTECTEAAFCSSDSAVCPHSTSKPDISPCENNSKVCKGGECNASICLLFGMEQCFITEDKVPRNREGKESMCYVACQFKDRAETCRSTSDKDFPFRNKFNVSINGGIRLRPGAPCNSFRGYCDIFYRCRRVDGDGPLRRLTTSLFSQQALLTAANWITTYWWAVMLISMGVLIFMGLFIKCCAVHTPSSNPKKRPPRRLADDWHSISSTLRRVGRHHSDGVRHHRERVPRHRDPRHGRRGRHTRSENPGPEPSAPASIPLVQVHSEAPPPYSQVISENPAAAPAKGGPPRGHRKNRKGQNPAGPSVGAVSSSSSSQNAQRPVDQILAIPPATVSKNNQKSDPKSKQKKLRKT